MRLNQKATRTHRRVVDSISCLGLDQLHQEPHHLRWGVKFAAFLSGAVGKVFNQIFISRSQQVGKLKIIVDQHKLRLVEVIQQVFPFLVRNFGLALGSVEIDVVLQHACQGIVGILYRRQCFIQHVADVLLQVLERGHLGFISIRIGVDPRLMPASAKRHKEGLAIRGFALQQVR